MKNWFGLYSNLLICLLLHLFTVNDVNARCFFCIWVFFHEDSRFTRQQRKEEATSLTLYHCHLLHRHLDISWVITAESSPLHIASSRTRTENLKSLNTKRKLLTTKLRALDYSLLEQPLPLCVYQCTSVCTIEY